MTTNAYFPKRMFAFLLSILGSIALLASGDTTVWKTHSDEAEKALRRHDISQAESEYTQAIAEAEKFGENDGRLISTLSQVAAFYLDLRQYANAQELSERAVRLREKSTSLNRLEFPILLDQLAEIYLYSGKLDLAEKTYQRAMELAEPIAGKFHPLTGSIKAGLGRVAYRRKDTEKALLYLGDALKIAENPMSHTVVKSDSIAIYRGKKDEKYVAHLMNELGLAYETAGKPAEAEQLFQRSLKTLERTLGENSPDLSSPLFNLTRLYLEQKNSKEAQRLFDRLAKIAQKNAAPEHPIWRDLAGLELRVLQQVDPDAAVRKLNDFVDKCFDEDQHSSIPALYDQIIAIPGYEKNSQKLARVSHQLAANYQDDGKFYLADLWERRALEIGQKAFASDELALLPVYESLSELCVKRDKLEEAEPLYRKTLTLQEKKYGPESSEVAQTLDRLAEILQKKNQAAEASSLLERAKKIRKAP